MMVHSSAGACGTCGAPLPSATGRCHRCGAEPVAGARARAPEPWGQPERVRKEFFDRLYLAEREPWTYSGRAAEVMRHEAVVRTARSLRHGYGRILDIGCSLGQLTTRMGGLAPEVHGIDLSPTAVGQARARCLAGRAEGRGVETAFHFCVGGSSELPFRPRAFDLLLLCDGLVSWRLSAEDQAATLAEAHRVASPGGFVVLTEHLRVRQFDPFLRRLEESPLEIVSVRYLHNRLWYSVARALRPIEHRPLVRALLASRWLARVLTGVSRLAGRAGAKHILVVARRPVDSRTEGRGG